jgi:spoIIIJ-associated protein
MKAMMDESTMGLDEQVDQAEEGDDEIVVSAEETVVFADDSQDEEDKVEDSFEDNDEDSAESFSPSSEKDFLVPELAEEELDNIADTALEVIRGILYYFDAEEAAIEEYEGDEQELIFDVIGENLAVMIGRHGRTLDALQYMVGIMVNKRIGFHYPVIVDIEGYVNRRKQKLITLAKSSAARVIRNRRSVKLRPMSPYERRIIHVALMDNKRVRTESEGVEPNRQVVILPI